MTEKQDILEQAKKRFKEATTVDEEERRQADTDKRFAIDYEDCQWESSVKEARDNATPPRPRLTVNKIPEKIDQAEGEFRQLRPSIKVRGVDSEADPKTAEIYGGIIRHIEYNSNARAAYTTAHSSVLYCGRGAWRIDIEDAEDDPFIRDIVINRLPNALSVRWDPHAKKADKSDADYVFVTDVLSRDEFKAKYPKVKLDQWDDYDWKEWKTEDSEIVVAEYWWKEKEKVTYYRVKRTIGQVEHEITVREKQAGDIEVEDSPKEVDRPKVKWCKMIGPQIIDGPHEDWPSKYIPIVIETGKELDIAGQAKTRGMVRFARTPMMMYNYWISTMTEQIGLAPKAKYLLTAGMIKNHQAAWDRANIDNKIYLLFNADPQLAGGMPKQELPPQLSPALVHQIAQMDHDIMAAMGVYRPSLGDESAEESGKAILARQKQTNVGTYTFTDNFQTALVYSGKVLIDLIPYVYDTERVIRIRGDDDVEQAIPINARRNAPIMQQFADKRPDLWVESGEFGYVNDLSVGKYDLIVTIGPSYTSQRQEAVAQLSDVIPHIVTAMPQAAPAVVNLLVENMDMPGREKLLKIMNKLLPPEMRELEPGEEPPPPQITPEMIEANTKQMELMLKTREQDRKDFETQIKALVDLVQTEMSGFAEERANFQQLMGMLEQLTGQGTGGQS